MFPGSVVYTKEMLRALKPYKRNHKLHNIPLGLVFELECIGPKLHSGLLLMNISRARRMLLIKSEYSSDLENLLDFVIQFSLVEITDNSSTNNTKEWLMSNWNTLKNT